MEVILELSGHPKANVKKVVISDSIVVGRSQKCGLQIGSSAVSRRHCEIRVRENAVSVIDLGSSNGTFIDALRLPPGDETPLPSGARLNVGGVRFVVQYSAAPTPASGAPGGAAAAVAGTAAAAAAVSEIPEEDTPIFEPEAGLAEVSVDMTSADEDSHRPLPAEPADESPAEEATSEVPEPLLEAEASDEIPERVPEIFDDEPDLEAMFSEPSSPAAPNEAPAGDAEEEDVPIIEEDEDAAFSFLTDDDNEPASQKSSSDAEDSRLGDFLSQLGRD